ncbi:MAG: ATP-dependent transcriptional regulator [Symbiobacteriaceae bacterium]|jgi:LuxR family maltose regulon positive regulatory protein|nr:ATP-dependent transcriptional regulator [Symbiobacteriaceae bacterium]
MIQTTPQPGAGLQSLLRTKLFAPRSRPRTVARPRLIARLTEGLQGRLTLIAAPPGFGKTSLVAAWRSGEPGDRTPLAWLSVDEGDNDPVRFWTYVAAALETVRSGAGADALSLLQATGRSLSMEAVLMALINGMAELPDDFVLALDDCHLIRAEPIHEGLAFLVEHLPPHAHLLLIARADPPLPLARLRARGDLVEVRAKDLRFTPEEAADLLVRVQGLALSAQEMQDLTARTEGWVAGLQLAALSLQGLEDVSGFMADLMGSNRFIVDYLAEEVLQRQPADMQRFLLQTSVLDRLSGPLCDAVTGRPESQALLERLESGNLFTVALDGERRWYRYHGLFADMLKARLLQQCPDEVPGLCVRASEWYEQQDMAVEAARAALAGGAYDRAARLIAGLGDAVMQRGEGETLRGLIESLPDEVVRASPGLCVFHARTLLIQMKIDAYLERLQAAEAALAGREGDPAIRGRVAALKSFYARTQGDARRSLELAEAALALLPADDPGWRILATISLAAACHLTGQREKAGTALREVVRLSESAGDVYQTTLTTCLLAEFYGQQGALQRAWETYQAALQVGGGQGERMPCAGMAFVGMAGLHLEWGEPEAAERLVLEGVSRGLKGGHPDTQLRAYPVLAGILHARGESALNSPLLGELAQALGRGRFTVVGQIFDTLRARICLQEGQVGEAVRLGQHAGPDPFQGAALFDPTVYARLLAAQGRPEEAVAVLRGQLAVYEQTDAMGLAVQVLIAMAGACQAAGDAEAAVAALEQAMVRGEPAGFFRSFIDEGAPMVPLLRAAARGTAAPAFARRLLTAMGEEPERAAPGVQRPPQPPAELLAEPLSDRETEVLLLVAEGLSNQEIADRAFIAVGTVKRHLHNILAKLEAKDRREALARARRLGLLGS